MAVALGPIEEILSPRSAGAAVAGLRRTPIDDIVKTAMIIRV